MVEPMKNLVTLLQAGRAFGVRSGMLRLGYEIKRGSGLLSWRMRSVQGWNSWTLERIAPGATAEDIRAVRLAGKEKFFFTDVRSLATSLREIVGADGQKSILADAERILGGNLPFFGQLSFPCGFPPPWFQNPATSQSVSPDQPWTQMRFASPIYGDLKFILEPSRFLFIYSLVRAYALSGDECFPQAFWSAIEDWARHSPPMSGPLWICGQECSLRILAWSFALQSFIHSPSTTAQRVALLVSMIATHAWRTAQTLGYARSQRSNHLITEAVGLWTAGTLFPELREAEVWQNVGAQLLHEAVLDQITPQGVSRQHSFNYQRMNLHLLLWTLRLAEIHHAPLHHDIRQRALAAFDFICQWVDPASGCVPNYGSDDGSLILPLSTSAYRDFRPLLQLAATVLHRPPLKAGPWDEPVLWFGIQPGSAKNPDLPLPPSLHTGYFRLGDANSWALIRAGHYTRRPFQADQLHVDLWAHGINLARDPGTYLYNGPAPWNNALAGTAVHNTITVDHRDQMRRAGRFLWLDWAQAAGQASTRSSSRHESFFDHFEGEHDGYLRLGITHRRTVDWLSGAGWLIVDDVTGPGIHCVRLHWLVADLPYDVSTAPFEVAFRSEQSLIRWNMLSTANAKAAIVRAGRQVWASGGEQSDLVDVGTQLLGWESPTYGSLQPAVSLLYETRSRLPVRFATVVLTDDRCQLESKNGQLMVLRDDVEIHRLEFSPNADSAAKLEFSATPVAKI
jgi:hypothetical protein